jgi:hypothetical protein
MHAIHEKGEYIERSVALIVEKKRRMDRENN